MTKTLTRDALVSKLTELSWGEQEGNTFTVHTPTQDKAYCEYTNTRSLFHISFDGSNLYNAFNHYDEGNPYTRDNKFNEWLKEYDCYLELDHSYCGQIYQNTNN